MRAHKELLRDPLAYAESIGKVDRHHTIDALADEGKDTTMRLVIAPSRTVPMRTFGYVAAARHIQREYLPHAQLQIIIPRTTISAVNGIKPAHIERATEYFRRELFYMPQPAYTTVDSMLVTDKDKPLYLDIEHLLTAMEGARGEDRLIEQAARRNSSHVEYVLSHIALHDLVHTVDAFDPGVEPAINQRIISIGAQTERPFYNVRMAARKNGLGPLQLCEATGQIFTRHTLPPYLPRRQPSEGPALFDPIGVNLDAFNEPIMQDDHARRYDPVARDIAHLHDYMRMAYDSYREATPTG